MTIKEVRDKLDEYIKTGFNCELTELDQYQQKSDYLVEKQERENMELMLIDDGCVATFFKPEILLTTQFEKELGPGVFDKPKRIFGITFDKFNPER